jgi:Tfp pilus assembly protein PilF
MPATPTPPAQKLLELAARSMRSGDFAQAESHLRNVLLHDPSSPVALHLLGLRAWINGNRIESRQMLERAVQSAPENVEILTSFATMLHDLDEPQPALDTFLRILALDTSSPEIWNAAGICLRETDQPALAVEFYLRALQLRPEYAEAYSNLAAIMIHEGDLDGAIDHLRTALKINPALADIHHNLGTALRNRFEYDASIASLIEARRLKPGSADVLGSLGEVLSLIGSPAAEPLLRQAVHLLPRDPEKHWNLALHLLKAGNFTEGFHEYDWRWRRPTNQKPMRPYPQPFWRGEPTRPLANTTILIYTEQGFGDTFHFLRYLPLVLAQGARIILEVQPALKRIATLYAHQLDPAIVVLGEGEAAAKGESLPPFDLHTSLLTLPLAFATSLETTPPPIRLTPPAPLRNAAGPLRVGIVWSGNPRHDRDRERSIPPQALAPLFAVPNCTWVSLQVGKHSPPPSHVHLEQPTLHDFLDTANLIDTLDLVLTVDTSVAHLAASQGGPTWILLPFVSEWRWLSAPAETTPWYPQARLFRQKAFPDGRSQSELWQPVIAEVCEALQALADARLATP